MPVPPLLLWLGAAGLIPFFASAAASFAPDEAVRRAALTSFAIYGGVILSFLGGVRWGLALTVQRPIAFVYAVIPSIIGWAAALAVALGYTGAGGGAAFAVAFVAQYVWDQSATRDGAPAWYPRLRLGLTIGVLLSCVVLAASTALRGT